MGKRPRAVPPAGRKVEVRELSDSSKLVLVDFNRAMNTTSQQINALVQQFNQTVAEASNAVGALLLEKEGLDREDGWRVNLGTARVEKHPVPKE